MQVVKYLKILPVTFYTEILIQVLQAYIFLLSGFVFGFLFHVCHPAIALILILLCKHDSIHK